MGVFSRKKKQWLCIEFYASIDFLIINSNFETFSVVTAEALASGKPVIASRCGGPEQFITPETGLLVEPRNQKELEAAMVYMSENYQNYNVETLQNSIRQPYSKEVIGKQFYNIYEKCLDV